MKLKLHYGDDDARPVEISTLGDLDTALRRIGAARIANSIRETRDHAGEYRYKAGDLLDELDIRYAAALKRTTPESPSPDAARGRRPAMSDQELKDRLARIENAVSTLAWWLVDAQTGFARRDAEGIEKLLAPPARPGGPVPETQP